MKTKTQASCRKPNAAHEAAHDQPQNRRAETTPAKPESASSGMSESEFLTWLDSLDLSEGLV